MSGQPTGIPGVVSLQSGAAEARPTSARLVFVDNIRVFLTVLVLLHHLMITYAGTRGWYYKEGQPGFVVGAIGGWFCSINQSYFMGLFLLISAYFVPGSYERKGEWRFFKDRLIRLGIPLALYSWIVNPIFVYLFPPSGLSTQSFWSYFPVKYFQTSPLIGSRPLWFIEVLLIFSLVYIMWRRVRPAVSPQPTGDAPFPANWNVALFALVIAALAF